MTTTFSAPRRHGRKGRYENFWDTGPSPSEVFPKRVPGKVGRGERQRGNLMARRQVFYWVQDHGYRMRISNDNYHWIIEGFGLFAVVADFCETGDQS